MSLPCYVLPAQFNKFLHDNNKRGTLTLKSLGSVVTPSIKWGALDRDKMYIFILLMVIGLSVVQFGLYTSMITDRIGQHKVLLPINHNHYNF